MSIKAEPAVNKYQQLATGEFTPAVASLREFTASFLLNQRMECELKPVSTQLNAYFAC